MDSVDVRTPFAGRGEIVFTREGGEGHTAVTQSCASSPLRILCPKPCGPSAWAFTSNFGGGLVAGDHLSLKVEAEEGTNCYLSTQSSTKVYRSGDGRLAEQSLEAVIGEGALLVCTPDPVVCFARSRYQQSQRFDLAGTGSLVFLDWFTSGRHGCNERWELERLESRNQLFIDSRHVLADILRLDNGGGDLASPFRMGACNCYATLVLVGPRVAVHAEALLRGINAAPVEKNAALIFGASPLADGLILRLAAMNTEAAAKFLYNGLGFLAELLGEHPWLRKW